MLWKLLLAAAGLYVIFIIAPAIVASITIFKGRPGTGLDELTAPGAQLAPFADKLLPARARLLTLPHRIVSCTARDGLALGGEYWDLGSDRTAIFAHGYRSDMMVNFAVQADVFARRGYNVLMICQRGHDGSTRTPTAMGLKEQFDLLAWSSWATAQPGVTRTVLYGMSMGAASVAYASDKVDPAVTEAVIIDCGYDSPYEQISGDCRRHHLPRPLLMPVIRLFVRIRQGIDIKQRTVTSLRAAAVPCFFLHGTVDRTVPLERGIQNYEECAAVKEMFIADGAGHTEAFLTDPAAAEEAVFRFIRSTETKEEDQK